jgi:hypothetical protein
MKDAKYPKHPFITSEMDAIIEQALIDEPINPSKQEKATAGNIMLWNKGMFGNAVNADIANRITSIRRFLKKQGTQSSAPSVKFPVPLMFPDEGSSTVTSSTTCKPEKWLPPHVMKALDAVDHIPKKNSIVTPKITPRSRQLPLSSSENTGTLWQMFQFKEERTEKLHIQFPLVMCWDLQTNLDEAGNKFIIKLTFNGDKVNIPDQTSSSAARDELLDYYESQTPVARFEIDLPFQVSSRYESKKIKTLKYGETGYVVFTLTQFTNIAGIFTLESSP